MTDMDFSVSEDTQATLLLCGALGKDNGAARPLTLPQYNAVVQALVTLGKRPSDLLHEAGLAQAVCSMPVENARLKEPLSAERLKALLDRGFALSMALNRWAQHGVRPVGRGDGLYPIRMKQHLKANAPAVLYYAGRDLLWLGGGMAVVGSRDISDEATNAIQRIVRECVDANMAIVSGGARGADRISMRAAFDCGGNVIAALSGDLMKTCLARETREAIAGGTVLLFSAVDPDDRFTPINAMNRNKFIYAMADYAFVAQSDTKGGTWAGAVEELKRSEQRPLFVYMGVSHVEGSARLVAQGGLAWTPSDSLLPMLEKAREVASRTSRGVKASQLSLFDCMATYKEIDNDVSVGLMQVSEPTIPYRAESKPDTCSLVLPALLSAAERGTGLTEKALRKKADPDGLFSPKGWKRLLEKACSEGKLLRMEKPKKRGRPDILYMRSKTGERP